MSTAAAVSASVTFADLLAREGVKQPDLAAHLDALDTDARVRECRALSGKLQKRLWEACAGAPAFTLDDLVPQSTGDKQIIYAGKNSLALFSHFEKRFVRQDGAVVGYNFQSMSWLTGPGYFTVVQGEGDRARELWFDYTRVPSRAPAGWPPVKANTGGFAKMVYGNLWDYCRRVSRDVIIGKATRLGKEMENYFVLART
jgi:hypothetical protein